MTIIVISGTPATGKTTLAHALSSVTGYKVIDNKRFLEQHPELVTGYDTQRGCDIIDTDAFITGLTQELSDDTIIDSHLAHELPPDSVDIVLITTCTRPVLKKRMQQRNYDQQKIDDNIEAEIFDICYQEAIEAGHKDVRHVHTTHESAESIAQRLAQELTKS